MAFEGVRKSLSREEHAIRMRFDALEKGDERRTALWHKLQDLRSGNARQKERLFVRVRLQEDQSRAASCLIADLRFVHSETQRAAAMDPTRIDCYVKCDVVFDTSLLPCERPGPCPHEVVVYVMKTDNTEAGTLGQAWEALRQLAAQQHKTTS